MPPPVRESIPLAKEFHPKGESDLRLLSTLVTGGG